MRFDHVGQALTSQDGDGRYDFQASGEFVLFESTEDGMVAQTRFEIPPARPNVTITTAAAIDLAGDRVMLDESGGSLGVRVNGVITPLVVGVPLVLPGGGQLERVPPANSQDELVLTWPDTTTLSVTLLSFLGSSYLNLFPDLAPNRFGKVRGLLGNANGVIGDDLNLRDGMPADPADLYTTYADSWRISQVESLFDYEPGEDTSTYNGTPPDPDFGLDDLDPAERAAAEATCIAAGITDDPLLSECALDVALLGGAATGGGLDTLDQVPDIGTYIAVSGQASIFQAGRAAPVDLGGGGGFGLLPSELPLDPGTGRVLQVLDSAGAVTFFPGEADLPPDGIDFGQLEWGSWNGLAGPTAQRMGQVLGVFLDASVPSTAPSPIDCGSVDTIGLAPAIGQIFCLGDGLSASNEPQTFFVPDGATRLLLGHAERLSSQLLESEVHHLGDNFGTAGLFALAPNPEGPSFTSAPFDIPTASAPGGARALLDLADTSVPGNTIRVNGTVISNLPVTGPAIGDWTEDVAFDFDPALLLATGNVIELRSTGGNLDDYLFKDLRVVINAPFSQLSEPNDPTPVHLGDDVGSNGLFALDPSPNGATWESAFFDAPNVDSTSGAQVLLDLAQTDFGGSTVRVNGTDIGALPVHPEGETWTEDVAIAFNAELLRSIGNQIEIESVLVGGNLDDFMIRSVRVEVASAATMPPGGYSDNAGVHEFILEVGP